MYDLWKSLIVEFLGTFSLVFVGAGATALSVAQGGSVLGSALAFGLIYIVLIYTWGSYSGANFNPAISFGLAAAGRLGWCRMLLYWIAQFLGAIAAAALVSWIFGIDFGAGAPVGDLTYSEPWKVVVLELVLTFFLVITFLFMTRNPMVSLISGFVIGLVLAADILVGGYLARVGVNPAYALAADIFSNNLSTYWIYIVGPLLGALLAALIYKAFTIPWTCAEIEATGCADILCGQAPFYEEWKECDPEFIKKGKMMYEENKAKLEAMPPSEAKCFTPCNMPEAPCEYVPTRGKKNYRHVQL
jgi:glycerol uptake facilitator-like aquaporin